MEKPTLNTARVATVNIWNREQDSLNVGVEERYRRFFKAATADNTKPLQLLAVQELSHPHLFTPIAETYGLTHHIISPAREDAMGNQNRVAIYSQTPLTKAPACTNLNLENAQGIFATTTIHTTHIGIFSIHNTFGFTQEHTRLENLHQLHQTLQHIKLKGHPLKYGPNYSTQTPEHNQQPLDLALLAGDLNAEPNSDSIRYLTNQHTYKNESPLWIGRVNQPTSQPGNNAFSAQIAKSKGLDPQATPDREIDYLLSYGWCYGTVGHPHNTQLIYPLLKDGEPLEYSDHLGIVSDIQLKTGN